MRICVITYYYKVVVGSGAQLCTLLEVWVLGVGMSKRLCTSETSLYAERVTDLKIDGVTLTATSSLDEGAADVCF
jgi:hypothetical protein